MRRKPDGIDSQGGQVIKFFCDALEITDTIPIAVCKRTRIDLIENCFLPPFKICHHASTRFEVFQQFSRKVWRIHLPYGEHQEVRWIGLVRESAAARACQAATLDSQLRR